MAAAGRWFLMPLRLAIFGVFLALAVTTFIAFAAGEALNKLTAPS